MLMMSYLIITIIVVVATPLLVIGGKPPGQHLNCFAGSTPIGQSCIVTTDEKIVFNQAEKLCAAYGGHLLAEPTKFEMSKVCNALNDVLPATDWRNEVDWLGPFIGISFDHGNWRWSSGTVHHPSADTWGCSPRLTMTSEYGCGILTKSRLIANAPCNEPRYAVCSVPKSDISDVRSISFPAMGKQFVSMPQWMCYLISFDVDAISSTSIDVMGTETFNGKRTVKKQYSGSRLLIEAKHLIIKSQLRTDYFGHISRCSRVFGNFTTLPPHTYSNYAPHRNGSFASPFFLMDVVYILLNQPLLMEGMSKLNITLTLVGDMMELGKGVLPSELSGVTEVIVFATIVNATILKLQIPPLLSAGEWMVSFEPLKSGQFFTHVIHIITHVSPDDPVYLQLATAPNLLTQAEMYYAAIGGNISHNISALMGDDFMIDSFDRSLNITAMIFAESFHFLYSTNGLGYNDSLKDITYDTRKLISSADCNFLVIDNLVVELILKYMIMDENYEPPSSLRDWLQEQSQEYILEEAAGAFFKEMAVGVLTAIKMKKRLTVLSQIKPSYAIMSRLAILKSDPTCSIECSTENPTAMKEELYCNQYNDLQAIFLPMERFSLSFSGCYASYPLVHYTQSKGDLLWMVRDWGVSEIKKVISPLFDWLYFDNNVQDITSMTYEVFGVGERLVFQHELGNDDVNYVSSSRGNMCYGADTTVYCRCDNNPLLTNGIALTLNINFRVLRSTATANLQRQAVVKYKVSQPTPEPTLRPYDCITKALYDTRWPNSWNLLGTQQCEAPFTNSDVCLQDSINYVCTPRVAGRWGCITISGTSFTCHGTIIEDNLGGAPPEFTMRIIVCGCYL